MKMLTWEVMEGEGVRVESAIVKIQTKAIKFHFV
jgi:hypothetical protein